MSRLREPGGQTIGQSYPRIMELDGELPSGDNIIGEVILPDGVATDAAIQELQTAIEALDTGAVGISEPLPAGDNMIGEVALSAATNEAIRSLVINSRVIIHLLTQLVALSRGRPDPQPAEEYRALIREFSSPFTHPGLN